MLISEVIMKNKRILRRSIDESLTKSYLRTWLNCCRMGSPPQEPDYIADLSLRWVSDAVRDLKRVLRSKFRVGITGVYCHQKPLADFGTTPRPEIGDLLLFLKYQESGSAPIFNSLLFQAKTSSSQNFIIGSGDLHQLKLYEEWPKFQYRRAGPLNNQTRDIHPKRPCTGAKYLLVDSSYIGCHAYYPMYFPFGCAVPNRSITLTKSFTDEFIDFLTLDAGKVISDKSSATEDWSNMIWDLLDITRGKCAKRHLSGLGKGFPRQTTSKMDAFFYMAGEDPPDFFGSVDNSGGDQNYESDQSSDDENGGISVLYIQISANESQENT
ncbi:hypothetical protein [Methylophaga sp.]|uniref:hypothetical protein n=1 Tax=Methylophaga sp. TaxID=2024840 RepID=UPI0027213AF8|nr:hypothetical protein [Methylophaga sp.]MDO8826148.1 hypothetical protein [Methylophaga sp.]